jgi:hypothetical protein
VAANNFAFEAFTQRHKTAKGSQKTTKEDILRRINPACAGAHLLPASLNGKL